MFSIITTDPTLHCINNKLSINFVNKIKLATNICPNLKMKRLIRKGYKRLEIEFDLIEIIKQHMHHHKHLKEHGEEDMFVEESLNIDFNSSSEEDEEPAAFKNASRDFCSCFNRSGI